MLFALGIVQGLSCHSVSSFNTNRRSVQSPSLEQLPLRYRLKATSFETSDSMPSFAELKAKAAQASQAGKEKFNDVRDRNTSVPMAKTNWDPYSGQPPPPPPPRSLVNQRTKPVAAAAPPLLPPPSRSSGVASPSLSRVSAATPPPPSSRPGSGTGAPPPPRGRNAAPPAPPPRTAAPPSGAHSSFPALPARADAGPPVIVKSTRPGIQPHYAQSNSGDNDIEIDWANLTPRDKEVFFSWLDEYFANFSPSRLATASNYNQRGNDNFATVESHNQQSAPPPLRTTTKPKTWARPQDDEVDVSLSHPPPTQHGSAALDLAYYFLPATNWPSAWYNAAGTAPVPPALEGRSDHSYTSSWRSLGAKKTTNIGVFFSDLSIFWGSVDFTTSNPEANVTRRGQYLPPPTALGRDALLEAHETYGETIALFAESFLGTGKFCARGECWDLANEALKYFTAYDYIPRPVPSISRTHGHLIYAGTARDGGQAMAGRWRGGDDRIRRGDIAEWRSVRIGVKGRGPGNYFTLGDPDHTAVVVNDCVPVRTPVDGESLLPRELGVLVVVEQSVGQPPERRAYDLSCFEQGEMWIYRPISMQVYLGVEDIAAVPPEGLAGVQSLEM